MRDQRCHINGLAIRLRVQRGVAFKSDFRSAGHENVTLTVSVFGSGPSRSLRVALIVKSLC